MTIFVTVGADEERRRRKARERAETARREQLKLLVIRLGVTTSAFTELERALTGHLGHRPDPVVVLREITTWSAAAAIYREDWVTAANCLKQLARQAAEAGEPWLNIAVSAHQAALRVHAESAKPNTVFRTFGCHCATCKATTDVLFTFDQALREDHLPHASCETPPCACWIQTDPPPEPWQDPFSDTYHTNHTEIPQPTYTVASIAPTADGRLKINFDPDHDLLDLQQAATKMNITSDVLWSMVIDGHAPIPDQPKAVSIANQQDARWYDATLRRWRERLIWFHPLTPVRFPGLWAYRSASKG